MIRRFIRNIELHGHHRDCDCSQGFWDRYEHRVCTCAALDEDDFIAAGEAEYDAWKDDQLFWKREDERDKEYGHDE